MHHSTITVCFAENDLWLYFGLISLAAIEINKWWFLTLPQPLFFKMPFPRIWKYLRNGNVSLEVGTSMNFVVSELSDLNYPYLNFKLTNRVYRCKPLLANNSFKFELHRCQNSSLHLSTTKNPTHPIMPKPPNWVTFTMINYDEAITKQ